MWLRACDSASACLASSVRRYDLKGSRYHLCSRIVQVLERLISSPDRCVIFYFENRGYCSCLLMNGSSPPVRQRAQLQPQVREHVGPSPILCHPKFSVTLRLLTSLNLPPFLTPGFDHPRASARHIPSKYAQGREWKLD